MAKKNRAILYGLVLAGGKSSRMGSDKGMIKYHAVPQQEYLYKLLEKCCEKVFLSVRKNQKVDPDFNTITDKDEFKGPYNGMLSAHKAYPNAAWLVLACDLPLMDSGTVEHLVKNRNIEKLATSYATAESNLPEPLVTIWEPSALEKSVVHLNTIQSTCPRKFLINSDIQIINPADDQVLYNANNLEDYNFAMSKLNADHGQQVYKTD